MESFSQNSITKHLSLCFLGKSSNQFYQLSPKADLLRVGWFENPPQYPIFHDESLKKKSFPQQNVTSQKKCQSPPTRPPPPKKEKTAKNSFYIPPGKDRWLATPMYWFIMAPKTNRHLFVSGDRHLLSARCMLVFPMSPGNGMRGLHRSRTSAIETKKELCRARSKLLLVDIFKRRRPWGKGATKKTAFLVQDGPQKTSDKWGYIYNI